MAKNSIVSKSITSPVFVVAFPYIFTPNDKDKYGLTMLFDKSTFKADWLEGILDEVVGHARTVHYKGQQIPQAVRVNPLRDGDEPNGNGNIVFPGYYYVNASTKFQPGLVDSYKDPVTNMLKIITDPNDFYAGCYARAKIHAFWYNVDGNKGVALSIGNIQKVKDGTRLGGLTPATHDFEEYEDIDTLVSLNNL